MRKQNNIQAIVLGMCFAVCAGAAQAQARPQPSTQTTDKGLYLGFGLGQSQALDYDCSSRAHCETHGSVVKYFLGYQFARNWSAEIGFTDLGKVGSENPGTFKEDIKARLGEVTIVGSYPASGRLMIYGKAGAYYAHTTDDVTVSGAQARLSESAWGPTWGFGLQYYVWRGFAARLEAQRYMKVGGGDIGDSDYNSYTIGLLYKM
jgi:opacity protein-like surface antigen